MRLFRHIALVFFWIVFSCVSSVIADDVAHMTLFVDTGALDAVAYSPDGSIIAAGGRDNLIRLWDAKTGDFIRVLDGHVDYVSSIAFSPDGAYLASGGRDKRIYVWYIQTGAVFRRFDIHTDEVTGLAFTPDGLMLASGSRDATLALHHLDSGETVNVLENYGGAVWDVAFHPMGTVLATASENGSIWVYGLWGSGGVWLQSLTGHSAAATSVVFSPDGEQLLSTSLDGTVRLWDIATLREATDMQPMLILNGHLAPPIGAGFGVNGTIFSAGLDGTLRVWDSIGAVAAGKELAIFSTTPAPLTALAMRADLTQVATVSTSGTLELRDMAVDIVNALIDQNRVVVALPTSLPANNSTANGQMSPPAAASSPEIVPTPALIEAVSSAPEVAIQPTDAPAGLTLQIPGVSIRSGITSFPLDGQSWAIDPWEKAVGHLQGTAWLDMPGNIVLGGHSEYPDGRPGIFNRLYGVGIGDEILLQDGDFRRRYVVINVLEVNYQDLSVIYPTLHNRLTLITCDIPSYVAEQNLYYERLVIVADEVPG